MLFDPSDWLYSLQSEKIFLIILNDQHYRKVLLKAIEQKHCINATYLI